MSDKKYYSPRGMELIVECIADRPVLTVELYMKWYDLFIVHPNGQVSSAFECAGHKWDEAEDYVISQYKESAVCDHAFNPKFFVRLAETLDIDYCDLALELVAGRWAIDYDNALG